MEKPFSGIGRFLRFVSHQLKAGGLHSIHSPQVYALFEHLQKRPSANLAEAQKLRKALVSEPEMLSFEDPGREMKQTVRSVQSIAKTSAKSHTSASTLSKITDFFKPDIGLELGTSLGISVLYQHLGSLDTRFTTVEGAASTAGKASDNVKPYANIEVVHSLFHQFLDDAISKDLKFDYVYLDGHHQHQPTLDYIKKIKFLLTENSCVVMDDIHWSSGMEKAWHEIASDNSVDISIDIFHFGILLFRKGVEKQHFILRA